MKLLVLNSHGRKIGGVETYLAGLLPGLKARGHQVGWAYCRDDETQRPLVSEDPEIQNWALDRSSISAAVDSIKSWNPDVVYTHYAGNLAWENDLTSIAPTVAFMHDYSGLCITGMRHHGRPSPRPCHRDFGPACLACHPILQCGGRNFLKLPFLYLQQKKRLSLLQRHARVLSHSHRMLDLLHRHGIQRRVLRKVTHYVPKSVLPPPDIHFRASPRSRYSLLYSGRLEAGKGVLMLPRFFQCLAPSLDHPVELVVMGAGRLEAPLRQALENLKSHLPNFSSRWVGWVDEPGRDEVFSQADLLIMPSTWPEPFGQVGVEAARMGLPTVAFDVGGIEEWLHEGRNGRLVHSRTCCPEALAKAAGECLRDADRHLSMRQQALTLRSRFGLEEHLHELEPILRETTGLAP